MTKNSIYLFNHWIEKHAFNKYYCYYLGLFLMLCSLLLALPDFSTFIPDKASWQIVILKSHDLTNSLTHIAPGSWLAKKVFRLTVPLVMKVTKLSPLGIVILEYFLGYLLIVYSYKLSFRILMDPVSSTFLVSGMVFLYFGRASFYDMSFTWFDGIAYFGLIMTLYCRNPVLIFFFATSAAWTDERAFIALAIAFLFHQLKDVPISKFNFRTIIKPNIDGLVVLVAMFCYIAVRSFLTYEFNMHTSTNGANLSGLKTTLFFLPLGVWTFLEGFWLLYLLTLILSIRDKLYTFSFTVLTILFIFTILSGCVWDITRSGSYMVPIIFILVGYLRNGFTKNEMRWLLFICFLISFLFPSLVVCTDWPLKISMSNSIFILLLRHIVDFFIHNNFI